MQMKTFMKASGMKENEMGMESSQNETEITLKGIGSMISEKVKDLITSVRRTNFSQENGLMINLNVVCTRKLKMKTLLQRKRSLTSLINTPCQIYLKSNQLTQQVYLKVQWKQSKEIEQSIELSIFQSMKCLQSKNFKNLKKHFKLSLKEKKLSTFYL